MIATVSNILVEFNTKTNMYDFYRIKSRYCSCCGHYLGESRMLVKSITSEEYREKAKMLEDFIL